MIGLKGVRRPICVDNFGVFVRLAARVLRLRCVERSACVRVPTPFVGARPLTRGFVCVFVFVYLCVYGDVYGDVWNVQAATWITRF